MRVLPVLTQGERVVVALSGGADSVALLMCLKERPDLQLTAAHLNHAIRGEAADRDQAFVRALCARLDVDLIEAREDVPALAAARHEGLETAARAARRAFLLGALGRMHATAIATAHHASDQAETVLMHLCRGGGVHGAGGMRARDGVWAKPLLRVSKREIWAYLDGCGQPYCEDESNAQTATPRNAIRHLVLPQLEAIYPGAARSLGRYAAIAGDEDAYMDGQAQAFLLEAAQRLPFGVRLRECAVHPALLRRALRQITRVDFEAVSRLMALYAAPRGAYDAGGLHAERTGAHLYLIDPDAQPPCEQVPIADGAVLEGLGTLRMAASAAEPVRDDPFAQVLDAAALEGALLRTRRPGDRIWPLGAPGARLVSDVFVDRKIERPLRDWMPVVARGDRVLWLPGVCIAQEAAITKDTAGALRLAWMREDVRQWNSAE